MNAQRRKAIAAIHVQLDALKSELETITEQEVEYFDNMPESFQNGAKGEKAQEAIDSLNSALSDMESALDSINSATE